jgi:hypothetical protein
MPLFPPEADCMVQIHAQIERLVKSGIRYSKFDHALTHNIDPAAQGTGSAALAEVASAGFPVVAARPLRTQAPECSHIRYIVMIAIIPVGSMWFSFNTPDSFAACRRAHRARGKSRVWQHSRVMPQDAGEDGRGDKNAAGERGRQPRGQDSIVLAAREARHGMTFKLPSGARNREPARHRLIRYSPRLPSTRRGSGNISDPGTTPMPPGLKRKKARKVAGREGAAYRGRRRHHACTLARSDFGFFRQLRIASL